MMSGFRKLLQHIFLFTVMFSLFCLKSASAYADEQLRYIVKTAENSAMTLTTRKNNEDIKISDNLYITSNIKDFERNHKIEFYIPDYEAELFDIQYPFSASDIFIDEQWSLENINSQAARRTGITGNGVKIAVIDSGIDFNHPDLRKDNIVDGINCIINQSTGQVLDENDYYDRCGHGTMVTGIISAQIDNQLGIAGIADNALIMPIKVTDGDTLYLSSILLGLKRAIEYNCDIINLSLGGTFKNDPDAIDLLKEMILQAENAGIIVVAAVGNSGNSAINYPAGFEEVIGVGSININNEVSWFSQRNDSVFVVAPGENILSLYPDGSTLTDSGTSMAAPIVTSIAALVKEVMPECSSFEFKRILKETAIDIGILGYDIEYGYGKVDIQKIIEDIKEYLPEIIITQGISDDVKQIYIHNNTSDIKFANGYFVNYKDWNNKIMEQIIICSDIALGTGVINVPLYNNYNCFFLWDNMMRPYVQKYLIK